MQIKYKFNHSLFIFGLMILLFVAACPLVHAQSVAPGDLDTTFGIDGKVVTGITLHYDLPRRVRIQPDGKIVSVGDAVDFDGLTDLFIVRHNANGSLDTSFGTNGSVVLSFGSGGELFSDFVILPDGKLLVGGGKFNTGTGQYNIALFRYLANGARDTAFGTNGVVTTPVGSGSLATSVALQADGKLVVAGSTYAQGAVDKPVVVRYNPDGTVDNTFGTIGIVQTTIGNNFPSVSEVLAQTDGKLLVAGHADFSGNTNLFVVRYNADGTLDNTFGASGIVSTDIDNQRNFLREMALQPDGKIVVNAGNYNSNGSASQSSAIVRYNANGTLDSAFGTGGIVKITEPQQQNSPGIAVTLAIQQNGKILTAGKRNFTFAIARYNSNGTIDTSFGTNGIVVTPNNFGTGISSIALQTDGKIVAVGSVNDDLDVGLVRYLGDSITAPRTRFDFDGDGKADVSVFRPSNGVWYLQQSQAGFTGIAFGQAGDKITPADYDGDGKTDIAVYRDGIWYLQRSSLGFTGVSFGASTDIPVPADFNGDGISELAVFRPSDGTWYSYNLATNQTSATAFGQSSDKPVPADYDGDGKSDIAVFRDGTWYLLRSLAGFTGISFGESTDRAIPADYDGDGRADLAVFRPSNGVWYLQQSTAGFTGVAFGFGTDLPVPADYDGDGKADIAVFRDGTWYLQQSTNGLSSQLFGLPNDKPVPTAYLP